MGLYTIIPFYFQAPTLPLLSEMWKQADVHSIDSRGKTALHKAAHYGLCNVIQFLIQKNAYIQAKCNNGFTPLHEASCYNKTNAITLLIQHGADINAVTLQGFTPLHVAAIKNQSSAIELLLKYGADISVLCSAEGWTPREWAEHHGCKEAVDLLKVRNIP